MPTTATLTWTKHPDPTVTGYNAYRQVNPSGGPAGTVTKLNSALIPQGTETYVDTTFPQANEDLVYSVTAVNAAGESPHSATVDLVVTVNPPLPPSGLVVVLS